MMGTILPIACILESEGIEAKPLAGILHRPYIPTSFYKPIIRN